MKNTTCLSIFLTLAFSAAVSSCTGREPDTVADAVGRSPSSGDLTDSYTIRGERNYLTGYEAVHDDGDINVVVEIPTGSVQKWEVDKTTGDLKWEFVDGAPREVSYLGYPGNYGMIPRTLLPKSLGGDGDPLDVIVLGPAVERGSVIKGKLIGVLRLLDRGEQDDKLIAVMENTAFYSAGSVEELNARFNGAAEIIELWFANYKGPGYIETKGFGDQDVARGILMAAIEAYVPSDR